MRAKEIIELCEDERLSSQEIFDLVYDYFVKKMKSAGMRIYNSGGYVEAEVVSPVISDNKAEDYSRAYLRTLSKLFGKMVLSGGSGFIEVTYPNPKDVFWKLYPIFYVVVNLYSSYQHRSGEFQLVLYVKFSEPIKTLVDLNSLNDYIDFSTEDGRKKIFELIDSLAKFIRLTPLGTD